MSAVDKALRHIEALIAARRPQTKSKKEKSLIKVKGSRRAKPAKRARYSKTVIIKKPRVVSARAGHRSREAYNPPRSEPAITEALETTFAPAPTPPEVPGPISAPLYEPPVTTQPSPAYDAFRVPDWVDGRTTECAQVPTFVDPPVMPAQTPRRFLATGHMVSRGPCKAVDAETGRTCKLLVHPEDPDRHRSERGPFFRVALPGQTTFALQRTLDESATRSNGVDYSSAELSSDTARSKSKIVLANGERVGALKASITRNKAHAGDVTTEANGSRPSKYSNPEAPGASP